MKRESHRFRHPLAAAGEPAGLVLRADGGDPVRSQSESDVEALEVLLDSGAATAGRLSELMGLTTGAVTRVIDRLEQAGYVRRVPDPADRRRVIVEVVPDKVAAVEATMARVGEASAPEIGHYSEAELAVINDFLTRMETITREEATALRDSRESEGSADSSEYAAPIGGLSQARLLFRSGANELTLRGDPRLEDLYRAKFEGPVPVVRVRDGTVIIGYKGFGKPWDWRKRNSEVSLTARSRGWSTSSGARTSSPPTSRPSTCGHST